MATAPPLPSEFQGEWVFSEQRRAEEAKKILTPEQYASFDKDTREFKAAGVLQHPDITVSGASMIGHGDLSPEFDWRTWIREGSRITGKVIWHEDRFDPGDSSTEQMTLELRNGEMWMWLGGMKESRLPLVYVRKARTSTNAMTSTKAR